MSGFIVILVIIIGGALYAYFKVLGFKNFVNNVGGRGSAQVSGKEIEKLKIRLEKEKERTKQLEDWAKIQTDINTERSKQKNSLKIIQDGKK